jgi:hypothetical protein
MATLLPTASAARPVTEAFKTEYLEELDKTIQRYRRGADRAMVLFVVLRLALVVASASLPALTTFSDRAWSTGAAILVATLAGLDTQFRWGDEWQHYRSTQLAFDRLKRDYRRREAALDKLNEADREKLHTEDFAWLFTESEALLQWEADRFWKFRISKWQTVEKAA